MYRANRERFLEVLARENAAAVVFTGAPPVRSNDCEYLFRPHSDFYWLTGFREPESALVLVPAHGEIRTALFLRERDKQAEIWNGRRLGVERAAETLGVDVAFPIDTLWDRLPELLDGHESIVYRGGEDPDRDRDLFAAAEAARRRGRLGKTVPTGWVDPARWLHELRLFKSPEELELMRTAGGISVRAHAAAMAAAAPGKNERQIGALLDYTFVEGGGSGPAYNSIVAGGDNACILHYIENDRELADGDLLLIDAGCEYDCYASDVTRTFPVGGRFTPEQRALYDVVREAQEAACELVRPGSTQEAVHAAAVDVLVDGLLEHGLLKGTRDQVLEEETYRRFYMHKTGHWLGLDVHDCGAYFEHGEPRPLRPGMVTTVEPGLYVAPDDDTVEERWRGIGIRIEDDLVVTESGHEVLNAGLPIAAEEIEALCAGETLVPAG